MADIFYGADRGQTAVTRSTTTTGLDVELVVDDAVSLTKKDILLLVDAIRDAVKEDTSFNNV